MPVFRQTFPNLSEPSIISPIFCFLFFFFFFFFHYYYYYLYYSSLSSGEEELSTRPATLLANRQQQQNVLTPRSNLKPPNRVGRHQPMASNKTIPLEGIRNQTSKAVSALVKYVNSTKGKSNLFEEDTFITLWSRSGEHLDSGKNKPIRLKVPHSLYNSEGGDYQMCLFVKDRTHPS